METDMPKIDFSDGIADELNARVTVRWRYILYAVLIFSAISAYFGYRHYEKVAFTESEILKNKIVDVFKVRPHFSGRNWGTYWHHCGAWITADHVDEGAGRVQPDFTKGRPWKPHGIIDGAIYADEWPCERKYKYPVKGEAVTVIGYPARSYSPEMLTGFIHLRRGVSASPGYEVATWVVVFDEKVEPVVGGMSGGLVLDAEGYPVGILVTQNSPAVYPGIKGERHSADIVSIKDVRDIWE